MPKVLAQMPHTPPHVHLKAATSRFMSFRIIPMKQWRLQGTIKCRGNLNSRSAWIL